MLFSHFFLYGESNDGAVVCDNDLEHLVAPIVVDALEEIAFCVVERKATVFHYVFILCDDVVCTVNRRAQHFLRRTYISESRGTMPIFASIFEIVSVTGPGFRELRACILVILNFDDLTFVDPDIELVTGCPIEDAFAMAIAVDGFSGFVDSEVPGLAHRLRLPIRIPIITLVVEPCTATV